MGRMNLRNQIKFAYVFFNETGKIYVANIYQVLLNWLRVY